MRISLKTSVKIWRHPKPHAQYSVILNLSVTHSERVKYKVQYVTMYILEPHKKTPEDWPDTSCFMKESSGHLKI